MKKSKFINYQLPIIFILIIFTPAILGILGVDGFSRKDENRAFKDSFSLNINRLDDFPPDFDAFISDNFYFRAPLLEFFHRTKYFAFNISPHQDKAMIGKNGWFFKSGIELEVLSGKLDFTPETLEAFSNEWKKRKEYLSKKNIPVFWIIAPMKHRVYTDQLPYNVQLSQSNRITALQEHLDKDFPNLVINPLSELIAKKDSTKLYYKLDNHWNQQAGYITMQLLLDRLKAEFPKKNIKDIPPFHWQNELIQTGYHYNVMGIEELSEYNELLVIDNPQSTVAEKYGFPPVPGFAYPWEHENRFLNDSLKNGLRVLFIRDSFGEVLQPFARELFSESLFIFDAWQFKLNEEIIEQYNPDVIVFIGLETNPENFLKDYK